jgi:hypothetical protein
MLDMDAADDLIAQSLRLSPMLCKPKMALQIAAKRCFCGLRKLDQRAKARRFGLRFTLIAS